MLLFAALFPVLVTAPAKPADAVVLPAPKVQYRMNEATASTSPWVDANGWRILRKPDAHFYYDVPGTSAALAAAESFVYGADATIHTDHDGADPFQRMLTFLHGLPPADFPAMANIGVVDNGSAPTGEFMNLLERRNLLFRIVKQPDPHLDVNVEHVQPRDPSVQAQEIRSQLSDDKRLLRIYGSEVVIARLTGDGQHARLHLLNYATRPVRGLRVRVLGDFSNGHTAVFDVPDAKLLDYKHDGTATEFTIATMNSYAAIDLSK